MTLCPGCVTDWCKTGCADPNNCCRASDPGSCFQKASSSPSQPVSSAPDAAAQCTSNYKYVQACQSLTPGFDALPNSAQASCLCFNTNGSYNGTVWDDAASTCYAALKSVSAAQTVLDQFSSADVDACTKFVDPKILSSAGIKVAVGFNFPAPIS